MAIFLSRLEWLSAFVSHRSFFGSFVSFLVQRGLGGLIRLPSAGDWACCPSNSVIGSSCLYDYDSQLCLLEHFARTWRVGVAMLVLLAFWLKACRRRVRGCTCVIQRGLFERSLRQLWCGQLEQDAYFCVWRAKHRNVR
jgi:hypothetical protein